MVKQLEKKHVASWISFATGLYVAFIGVMHFPMAYEKAASPDFIGLAPNASDFLILLSLAVGILLITFGVLSLYFSPMLKRGEKTAQVFFLAQGILFLARTIIELMHPVAFPKPDLFVLVSVFLIGMLFLTSVVLSRVKYENGV